MFLMASCTMVDQIHFDVDQRLIESVNNVYREGEIRGRIFVRDRITFRVSDKSIDGKELTSTGLCEHKGTFIFITINEALFKNGQPDKLALDYMVFHEFGHAIGRGHTDTYSIMNPNKYAGDFHNDPEARNKLTDELFE